MTFAFRLVSFWIRIRTAAPVFRGNEIALSVRGIFVLQNVFEAIFVSIETIEMTRALRIKAKKALRGFWRLLNRAG